MSYALNRDIRSFTAASAIGGYLIAAAAGTDDQIRNAAAGTDKLLGISERVGASAGTMADVTVAGETEVMAGGDLDFEDALTSDARGRAVKAVPVAGQTVQVIGYLRSASASDGDIVRIHVAKSLLHTPA